VSDFICITYLNCCILVIIIAVCTWLFQGWQPTWPTSASDTANRRHLAPLQGKIMSCFAVFTWNIMYLNRARKTSNDHWTTCVSIRLWNVANCSNTSKKCSVISFWRQTLASAKQPVNMGDWYFCDVITMNMYCQLLHACYCDTTTIPDRPLEVCNSVIELLQTVDVGHTRFTEWCRAHL
jgi:hypothetical protein